MGRLRVHVTPKASREEIGGWRGAEILVRVTAAPEGGKANAAVERLVAAAFNVPKSAVRVVRGQSSRTKMVEIEGVDEKRVHEVFGPPDATLW